MKLIERLIDYCKFETTSSEESETFPSTATQFELAKRLEKDLKEIGVKDAQMDKWGYVYGTINANAKGYPTIGLISHMDTSDAVSGKDVKPRVIENYDGKDIKLSETVISTVERFSELPSYKGKTLIVTDGNTLLGGDDKAGVAIIMEIVEYLNNHPEFKHGEIKVCFNPDEEVGRGTEKFDYDRFKVDYAYTLDGELPNELECENFNAASAKVQIKGISTHPGSAKDVMINAATVAMEFDRMLPCQMRPEYTEGYEGFNHLCDIKGSCDYAEMNYIIRNHDAKKLEAQKKMFIDATDYLNKKYPSDTVKLTLTDSYRNMAEKFVGHSEPINLVKKAMALQKLDYKERAIRGGTDGAALTWNGILCPNLGTGAHNLHGKHEYVVYEEMVEVFNLVLKMIEISNQ